MVNDKALETAAALVVLARYNIPVDVQELLVSGNPMRGIRPDALAAAITAAKEGGEPGWQDISTAPKDGTFVLVYNEDSGYPQNVEETYAIAQHVADGWSGGRNWRIALDGQRISPTDWRPLPSPPASKGGEE